jgi:hypothetical protein
VAKAVSPACGVAIAIPLAQALRRQYEAAIENKDRKARVLKAPALVEVEAFAGGAMQMRLHFRQGLAVFSFEVPCPDVVNNPAARPRIGG